MSKLLVMTLAAVCSALSFGGVAAGIHPEGGACRVIAAETAKALGRGN